MSKICSSCLLSKQFTEFYKNSRYRDGYNSQCKVCVAMNANPEKTRARYQRYNAKRIRLTDGKPRGTNPRPLIRRGGTPKENKAAYKKEYRVRPDVLARTKEKRPLEREGGRKKRMEKYWLNHDHSLAVAQLYRERCPDKFQEWRDKRRARIKGAPVNDLTNKQWEMIKKLFHYRCAYCGQRSKRLTKDHIMPLTYHGPHTFSNIVPACSSCNSKKGKGPPLIPVQPFLLLPI